MRPARADNKSSLGGHDATRRRTRSLPQQLTARASGRHDKKHNAVTYRPTRPTITQPASQPAETVTYGTDRAPADRTVTIIPADDSDSMRSTNIMHISPHPAVYSEASSTKIALARYGEQHFAKVASPLRELTCHTGSRSVTCHPAEVTFPRYPGQNWYSSQRPRRDARHS